MFPIGQSSFLQHAAQDLARWRLRYGIYDFEMSNLLVTGHAVADEPGKSVDVDIAAGGGHYKSLGHLAALGIGCAEYGTISDVRMLEEDGLELGRRHAEALVFDHFLLAVDDIKVALIVNPTDISGVEPSISQDAGRFFRRVPVSLHDLGPANSDFAHFSGAKRTLAGLEVDNAVLGTGHQDSAALQ